MQFTLPVSKKERKSWKRKKPEGFNRGNDNVTFHAKPKKGSKFGQWAGQRNETPNFPGAACYAAIGPNYNCYEITCYPCRNPKKISFEDAFNFFNILTEYDVVPEGVLLWEEEKGIFCQVPADCGESRNIYAALSCYRWLDTCPQLVWEFLEILKEDTSRHPLQVLTYLIGKNLSNFGHSFITTYKNQMHPPHFESELNPTLGLAAKIYFDHEDTRKLGGARYDPDTYVNNAIGRICGTITPTARIKNPRQWGADQINVPKFILEKPEDALHPGLYELYTIPKITAKKVGEILERLFTKEKK